MTDNEPRVGDAEVPTNLEPAAALAEMIKRNNVDVYEGGGQGVWNDPDGGMLRYSAGLLAALSRHTLSVECDYWTCAACGPLGYTKGRPCVEVRAIADALDVAL
jgi:hypothetical protein